MMKKTIMLFIFLISFVYLLSYANAATCGECGCGSSISNNSYVTLTNNIVYIDSDCISLSGKSNITFDCEYYNITGTNTKNAIYLSSAQNITIKNCNIIGFNIGTYITTSSNNITIENTNITNSLKNGIGSSGTNNIIIKNTSISHVTTDESLYSAAVFLLNTNNTNITNTTITENRRGILLVQNSNTNTITQNTIKNNLYSGIELTGTNPYPQSNIIFDNIIYNNSIETTPKYEIIVGIGSENNNITYNSLKHPISDSGTSTILENNYFSYDKIVSKTSLFIYTPTIQQAIDQSSANDKILILPGTYNEQITISKPLNITGETQDTTITSTSQATITITENNTHLTNLTIENTNDTAITIQSSHNTIKKSSIMANKTSIHIENTDNNTIENNTITGRNSYIFLPNDPKLSSLPSYPFLQ